MNGRMSGKTNEQLTEVAFLYLKEIAMLKSRSKIKHHNKHFIQGYTRAWREVLDILRKGDSNE